MSAPPDAAGLSAGGATAGAAGEAASAAEGSSAGVAGAPHPAIQRAATSAGGVDWDFMGGVCHLRQRSPMNEPP